MPDVDFRQIDGIDVAFSGDTDRQLDLMAQDGLIRLRLQPQLLDPARREYVGWRQVAWTVVLSVADAKRLRNALQLFLRLTSAHGLDRIESVLKALEE